MVHPDNGDEVSNQEIQKGFEVEPEKFVIVTDEELKSLEPKPSREIEISEFVPPEKISQQWYERFYYLGPDGDENAYFALADALEKRKREGIAHWVMRNKSYVGALRAQDLQQVVKGRFSFDRDYQLTIDNKTCGLDLQYCFNNFRKVTSQGLTRFRLELNRFAVAEC